MGVSTGTLLVSDKSALERIFTETAGLIAVHAEDEDRMNERRKLVEEELMLLHMHFIGTTLQPY